LGFDTEVTRRVTDPSVPDSRFTFTLDNQDSTGRIVSSMSVTSFPDLDNALVTCLDSEAVAGSSQAVNIAVLGKADVTNRVGGEWYSYKPN
jgi:hypothetical protein